jgi:hypothetical protein
MKRRPDGLQLERSKSIAKNSPNILRMADDAKNREKRGHRQENWKKKPKLHLIDLVFYSGEGSIFDLMG